MNYYQITADIEDDFEELAEEEEDEDPNWLLTSAYSSPARAKNNLQAVKTSSQTSHEDTAANSASAAVNSIQSENKNGDKSRVPEQVSNQFEPVVMRRRPQKDSNVASGNVASGNDASNSNRASFYRFSRLIEGVASYVSGRPLHEEDGSVDSAEENCYNPQTTGSNDVSPSSSDSGFTSLNSRENFASNNITTDNVTTNKTIPHTVTPEDPLDAKITELFRSLESVPVSDDFRVVRRRRSHGPESAESLKNGRNFFQRRKQTVSGYFSDWAKWMTHVDPEYERYERYPG